MLIRTTTSHDNLNELVRVAVVFPCSTVTVFRRNMSAQKYALGVAFFTPLCSSSFSETEAEKSTLLMTFVAMTKGKSHSKKNHA